MQFASHLARSMYTRCLYETAAIRVSLRKRLCEPGESGSSIYCVPPRCTTFGRMEAHHARLLQVAIEPVLRSQFQAPTLVPPLLSPSFWEASPLPLPLPFLPSLLPLLSAVRPRPLLPRLPVRPPLPLPPPHPHRLQLIPLQPPRDRPSQAQTLVTTHGKPVPVQKVAPTGAAVDDGRARGA